MRLEGPGQPCAFCKVSSAEPDIRLDMVRVKGESGVLPLAQWFMDEYKRRTSADYRPANVQQLQVPTSATFGFPAQQGVPSSQSAFGSQLGWGQPQGQYTPGTITSQYQHGFGGFGSSAPSLFEVGGQGAPFVPPQGNSHMPLTYGNMGPLDLTQPFRTANWVSQQGEREEDLAKKAEAEKKKLEDEKLRLEMRETKKELEDVRKALEAVRLQSAPTTSVAGGAAAGVQSASGNQPAAGARPTVWGQQAPQPQAPAAPDFPRPPRPSAFRKPKMPSPGNESTYARFDVFPFNKVPHDDPKWGGAWGRIMRMIWPDDDKVLEDCEECRSSHPDDVDCDLAQWLILVLRQRYSEVPEGTSISCIKCPRARNKVSHISEDHNKVEWCVHPDVQHLFPKQYLEFLLPWEKPGRTGVCRFRPMPILLLCPRFPRKYWPEGRDLEAEKNLWINSRTSNYDTSELGGRLRCGVRDAGQAMGQAVDKAIKDSLDIVRREKRQARIRAVPEGYDKVLHNAGLSNPKYNPDSLTWFDSRFVNQIREWLWAGDRDELVQLRQRFNGASERFQRLSAKAKDGPAGQNFRGIIKHAKTNAWGIYKLYAHEDVWRMPKQGEKVEDIRKSPGVNAFLQTRMAANPVQQAPTQPLATAADAPAVLAASGARAFTTIPPQGPRNANVPEFQLVHDELSTEHEFTVLRASDPVQGGSHPQSVARTDEDAKAQLDEYAYHIGEKLGDQVLGLYPDWLREVAYHLPTDTLAHFQGDIDHLGDDLWNLFQVLNGRVEEFAGKMTAALDGRERSLASWNDLAGEVDLFLDELERVWKSDLEDLWTAPQERYQECFYNDLTQIKLASQFEEVWMMLCGRLMPWRASVSTRLARIAFPRDFVTWLARREA